MSAMELRQIEAAVDVEDVAGDVAGFVACQEHYCRGYVASRAHASQGDAIFQFIFHSVGEDVGHGGGDEAGGYGVDRDITRGDFYGDGFGEADQASFGSDIVCLTCVSHLGDYAGDVDDAACAG